MQTALMLVMLTHMSDNDDSFVTPDDPAKGDPMLVVCGVAVGVMIVILLSERMTYALATPMRSLSLRCRKAVYSHPAIKRQTCLVRRAG
jgi:hypothetical protein